MEDVPLGYICDCTPYSIYYHGMDAPQYVQADVHFKIRVSKWFISDNTKIWMLCSMYT